MPNLLLAIGIQMSQVLCQLSYTPEGMTGLEPATT